MANFITRGIPNLITCCNLLAGCMALVCAFHPLDDFHGLMGYEAAFLFIVIGAVADFLDGFSARLLKVHSPIGADLDSLADLVTFGVAPAMVVFNLMSLAPAPEWMRWSTMLIPVCGALRLARFNVDASQATVFKGLPIPSNALFCIGLSDVMASSTGFNPWAALGCILFIALLMVAPMEMISLKFKNYAPKGDNIYRYLLILTALVCIPVWKWFGCMILICVYILLSFVRNSMTLQQSASSDK